jgi:membrane protease YdiL (CAAX protease family)
MLKTLFLNPLEHRLRSGWRLILILVLVPFTSRTINILLKPLFGEALIDDLVSWIFRGIVVIISATLLVWLFRRFLDRKTFVSLGVKPDLMAVWDGLVGFILSGLMVSVVFLILLLSGFLEVRSIGWREVGFSPVLEILLWFFGIGAAVAWSEELGFRGYILQNLGEGIGIIWAIAVSCIIYGLLHMTNPNSTWLSGLLIAVIGFLRIFGWLRTGQLWLSMGMHAGWNFFQGPVFGFSVSGLSSESIIHHSLSGPAQITGGVFGPEAGIIIVPVIIMGLLVMYLWTSRRNDIPWKKLRKSDG